MSFCKPVNDGTPVNLVEYRPSLYYNKFKYKLRMDSPGLRCVRYPSITFHAYKQRIKRSVWGGEAIQIMEQNFDINIKIAQVIQSYRSTKEVRARQEYDTISFFSSDLSKILEIKNHIGIVGQIFEANPVLETGVMYFVKPPKHKYRAVFGYGTENNHETKEQVKNFLETYEEYVEASYKLRSYAHSDSKRYYGIYGGSFDFTDKKILTIVALSFGDCISKIYELKQRPSS